MSIYRSVINHLAKTVHNGLLEYIDVHNKIFKESSTFSSLLKNIFGRPVPMSQLLQDAEELIPKWEKINDTVSSFSQKTISKLDEDEKIFLEILNRYAKAVNDTVVALVERQKLLNERSKSLKNNPVNYEMYQESEKKISKCCSEI